MAYPVDVTSAEQVYELFEGLSKEQLRYPLRGLVTCAGISGLTPAIEYPEAEVRKMFDVNYFGTLFCAQGAARCFRATKVPGSVVFIASMSGSITNKVRMS
jgi:NAD(P)-dependent dehydrogenase (short-subunit alcohol dehydrogenase family)